VRYSVALFFGFHDISPEEAGRVLLQAFFGSDSNNNDENGTGENDRELISSAQSTIARQRHKMVQQEADCPSGMDTLIVNFFSTSEQSADHIARELSLQLANNGIHEVVLHGVRQLDPKAGLHAEQDCTQLVYHFMVPVTWLPESDDIVAWYLESVVTGDCRLPRSTRPARTETPPSLKRFKDIFRSVESATDPIKQVPRFRTLAYKVPRSHHNFCDPEIRASPNHDVTKRIVDRARFLKFHWYHDAASGGGNSGELFIMYEFVGDAFLPQQVRRIVGTAVGMVNGWLPEDYMSASLSHAVVQDTPLAPAGYLYQAGARFHFTELGLNGVRLFDVEDTIRVTEKPERWIQTKLLDKLKSPYKPSPRNASWLGGLRDTVAPEICAARRRMNAPVLSSGMDDGNSTAITAPPEEYGTVLKLLRDMVEQGQWPSTSVSRSSVIGTLADPTRAGSFTVVDHVNFDLTKTKLPKANALFPELTTAVFQLQASIVDDNMTSSHCAVNCNAQFTPHVDSGRGSGQSLSTIVGLGDFKSGELVVEGEVKDIRYRPLQFDGWKLRHWTRPFSGERFSLVWFTPEGIELKEEACLPLEEPSALVT